MTVDHLEVVVQGVLTGLVYGLMALGLSVIFGVVRVVNFAHGEFAVVGDVCGLPAVRDAAASIRSSRMLPIAAAFFGDRLSAADGR